MLKSVRLSAALGADPVPVSNGVALTEEEVAEQAKRHIDEAVATVAEMQVVSEQLKVHVQRC